MENRHGKLRIAVVLLTIISVLMLCAGCGDSYYDDYYNDDHYDNDYNNDYYEDTSDENKVMTEDDMVRWIKDNISVSAIGTDRVTGNSQSDFDRAWRRCLTETLNSLRKDYLSKDYDAYFSEQLMKYYDLYKKVWSSTSGVSEELGLISDINDHITDAQDYYSIVMSTEGKDIKTANFYVDWAYLQDLPQEVLNVLPGGGTQGSNWKCHGLDIWGLEDFDYAYIMYAEAEQPFSHGDGVYTISYYDTGVQVLETDIYGFQTAVPVYVLVSDPDSFDNARYMYESDLGMASTEVYKLSYAVGKDVYSELMADSTEISMDELANGVFSDPQSDKVFQFAWDEGYMGDSFKQLYFSYGGDKWLYDTGAFDLETNKYSFIFDDGDFYVLAFSHNDEGKLICDYCVNGVHQHSFEVVFE